MMVLGPSTSVANAQEAISGKYVDSSAGLKIDLPDGWSGTKLLGQIAIVSPTGFSSSGASPEAIIAIMSIPRLDARDKIISSEFAQLPEESSGGTGNNSSDCQSDSISYDKIGQTTVLQIVQECKDDGGHYSKTRAYGILTLTKFVVIVYSANSASAYEKYVNAFEQSLMSVHIDEPVDFKAGLLFMTGADQVYQNTPTVLGKPVTIKIQTSSKISNFQVSEEQKRISFTVEGDSGTRGVLMMQLQQVMEGPYQVTMDGSPAKDFMVIEDKMTGEKVLNMAYHHSTHDIVITGGTVVPEFPVHLIAIMGAIVGAIVVLSRVKPIPKGF